MSIYLELLRKYKIQPNFICSEEYFKRAKLQEMELSNWVYWEQHDWILCPPINSMDGKLLNHHINGAIWPQRIWSSFQDWAMPPDYEREFLDFEYIYDPKDFLKLEGNKWQVFRKNIRKFPGRYGNAPLKYIWISEVIEKKGIKFVDDQLKSLIEDWLNGQKEDKPIEDDEVILDYLFHGNRRKVLIDKNYTILAINIWDYNHHYINFRYCFARPEKFLSEYVRYLFYVDPDILHQNKFVNDGGSLDNINLEAFKDKMNPLAKRQVFKFIKTEEGKK